MKLGQVASMDPDLFPPEVRAILARLQNEAPPMPFERVAAVLEDELGGSPDELFAEFSRDRWPQQASDRCTAPCSTMAGTWW